MTINLKTKSPEHLEMMANTMGVPTMWAMVTRMNYLESKDVKDRMRYNQAVCREILHCVDQVYNDKLVMSYPLEIEFEMQHWNHHKGETENIKLDVMKRTMEVFNILAKETYLWLGELDRLKRYSPNNNKQQQTFEPVEEIQRRIEANNKLPEIVDALGIRVVNRGSNYLCYSPLRDDAHPSFTIHSVSGLWKDWATQDVGNVFHLVQRTLGVNFKEAIKFINTI